MKIRLLSSLVVMGAFILMSQPSMADDLEDLKATFQSHIKAVNSGDWQTVSDGQYDGFISFSIRQAFPTPVRNRAQWVKTLNRLKETWQTFRTTWYKPDFRVIGNTGLVWGLRTEVFQLKNGPVRTNFLKTSQTWVKTEEGWKIVVNHHTPLPPGSPIR
jgi:ketosteroid isomerase-like protein